MKARMFEFMTRTRVVVFALVALAALAAVPRKAAANSCPPCGPLACIGPGSCIGIGGTYCANGHVLICYAPGPGETCPAMHQNGSAC